LPAEVLDAVPMPINFHPGPPEHPGFAPYSWARYQRDYKYGVTAHRMVPKVDAGPILGVMYFPVYPSDSVYRLQQRAHRYLFTLAIAVACRGETGWEDRPRCTARWARSARTLAEFEALRQLNVNMSAAQIARRIHACAYPGQPGAQFPEDRR
jgi:methionyl-tRNA formyltransferase